MKFGAVPLAEAAGAILARSVRLSSGPLVKGRVLTRSDLERLAADAHSTVVVARLEPGDVSEDEAATRLARRCIGRGVRAEPAQKGRARLVALHPGIFTVCPERLDSANTADGALTIATLPRWTRVEAGDTVASIQVIPFAVPAEALDEAESSAEALLSVAPFQAPRVALILSRRPDIDGAQLDHAKSALRGRVAQVGGAVVHEALVQHEEAALARALDDARASDADVLLLMGATAIADPRDVAPAALRRTGGTVEHWGMPVEPGNLLMLGRLRGVPVVGVPGCARSPARCGFDLVFERLAAGLDVTPREIMAMGTGGLLPSARETSPRRQRPRPPRVGSVLMAAGSSQRMGATNKLLSLIDGAPMVARAVEALLASLTDVVVVVTGHEAPAVEDCLRDYPVRFARNPDFASGMSASLRAGLEALPTGLDAALVALADMPWIRPDHVDQLITAYVPDGPYSIVLPIFEGRRGNPSLWGAAHFDEMKRQTGDVGARALIRRHASSVLRVPMPDDAIHLDVDRPAHMRRSLRAGSTGG